MGTTVAGQPLTAELGQAFGVGTTPFTPPEGKPFKKSAASILVIDDDEAIRSFLSRLLERLGYTVSAAESGERGLDVWQHMSPAPQLLIADLMMPGMGGKQAALQLRKVQPGLKVLFITGSGSEEMAEAIGAVRNSHHLFKPFRIDQLIATIEKALAE